MSDAGGLPEVMPALASALPCLSNIVHVLCRAQLTGGGDQVVYAFAYMHCKEASVYAHVNF